MPAVIDPSDPSQTIPPQWNYQEFLPTNSKSTPTEGINAALTWLAENNFAAAIGTVFGNTDSSGVVRLFWYGTPPVPLGIPPGPVRKPSQPISRP
jgi:hypothetical protein